MSRPGGTSNLRDVAAAAGVSVKTVSNVVNGYAHVSDATRARVQQAIDELRYRPNLSARNLRAAAQDSWRWPSRSWRCPTSRRWPATSCARPRRGDGRS